MLLDASDLWNIEPCSLLLSWVLNFQYAFQNIITGKSQYVELKLLKYQKGGKMSHNAIISFLWRNDNNMKVVVSSVEFTEQTVYNDG